MKDFKSPWVIWFFAASFYFYQFILRVCPGVIGECLINDLNINGCTLGVIGACFYQAYAIMQIPLGIALDRYGVKKVFSTCCLISAIGTILFALSNTPITAGIGRFLTGAGSACGFIGIVKLITIIFDDHKIARVVGITTLLGTIGGTIGGAPLSYLIITFHWRNILLILGIIGIIIATLVYKTTNIDNNKHENCHDSLNNLIQIIKNKQIWLLGTFGGLMYVPLAVIADLWGTPFISSIYNINLQQSSFITSCIYIGVSVGAPLIAYCSDLLNNRKLLMYICAITSLIIYSIIINTHIQSVYLMCILLFIGGFCFGGQCLTFSIVVRAVKSTSSGIALGFMNTIIMLSGVLFEPLVGYLLDYQSNGGKFHITDYRYSLNVVPICLALSIIILHYTNDYISKKRNKRK